MSCRNRPWRPRHPPIATTAASASPSEEQDPSEGEDEVGETPSMAPGRRRGN